MHQIPFRKTHNLGELLDLVAGIGPNVAESLREVTALNPYSVIYRYPGDFPEMTKEDAMAALELAARVRATVTSLLSAYLQGS